MSAIATKFIGPTDHKGARVSVRWMEGPADRVEVPWDHSLDVGPNHDAAFKTFCQKHNVDGAWSRGSTSEGYVYVKCLSSTLIHL